MAKQKNNVMMVYIITILTTFVLVGGTAYIVFSKFIKLGTADSEESSISDIYYPTESDRQTILVTGTQLGSTKDDLFMVIRFIPDAEDRKIVCIPISANTQSQVGTTQRTVGEAFDKGGISLAKEAVENALGIKIDKYIRFNQQSFSTLLDYMGNTMKYNVPYKIVKAEKDGSVNYEFEAGSNSLNATQMLQLMSYDDYPNGEQDKVRIFGQIISEYLNQNIFKYKETLPNRLDEAFLKLINIFEDTDVNDLYFNGSEPNVKPALTYIIEGSTEKGVATLLLPIGTWEADKFSISEDFKISLIEELMIP